MQFIIFTSTHFFMKILKVSTYILLILLPFVSCKEIETIPSAQKIVDQAIASAGGETIANSSIHFKFRDYYYRATRTKNLRTLERCTDKECQVQQDVLNENGEFIRFRESELITVPDSMKTRYGNSINSVHYFSVLPYGLNDPAVKKTFLDETTVKNQPYYRIKVSFKQEGGGDDFKDEYLYWIHKETYNVDYLAYNYQTAEGGTRFREAYNERIVNGVRIVDYKNYKPKSQYPPLDSLDILFENNELNLLSTIDLENVTITAATN